MLCSSRSKDFHKTVRQIEKRPVSLNLDILPPPLTKDTLLEVNDYKERVLIICQNIPSEHTKKGHTIFKKG